MRTLTGDTLLQLYQDLPLARRFEQSLEEEHRRGRIPGRAAPVRRIGAQDAPIPIALSLEGALLPGRQDIIQSAREMLSMQSIREGIHG